MENHRLVIYPNQYLYQWHVNRNLIRNEKLTAAEKVPVGYFVFHNEKWLLVNQTLSSLKDVTENVTIPIGGFVELLNDKKLLFSDEEGGRVALISITA